MFALRQYFFDLFYINRTLITLLCKRKEEFEMDMTISKQTLKNNPSKNQNHFPHQNTIPPEEAALYYMSEYNSGN